MSVPDVMNPGGHGAPAGTVTEPAGSVGAAKVPATMDDDAAGVGSGAADTPKIGGVDPVGAGVGVGVGADAELVGPAVAPKLGEFAGTMSCGAPDASIVK
jgi:hypothetical protein